MHNAIFHLPAPIGAPRFAPVASWLAAQVVFGLRHVGRWLTSAMRRPAVDSRHTEAASLRDYAQQMLSHDPRFAADLFAAADRHERRM